MKSELVGYIGLCPDQNDQEHKLARKLGEKIDPGFFYTTLYGRGDQPSLCHTEKATQANFEELKRQVTVMSDTLTAHGVGWDRRQIYYVLWDEEMKLQPAPVR